MHQDPFSFEQVYKEELETIRNERLRLTNRKRLRRGYAQDACLDNPETPLTGLALSGGGIRSATFNLGVIQGLAQKKWLEKVDYLSTVSGGGYIGSWLSALIHREGHGNVDTIQERLPPVFEKKAQKEIPAIHFLRDYSNYLTPRTGILSADTLSAVTTYLRNLILNFLILVFALSTLFFVPLLYHNLVDTFTKDSPVLLPISATVTIVSLLVAIYFIGLNLFFTRPEHRTSPPPWWAQQGCITKLIALPLVIAAAAIAHILLVYNQYMASHPIRIITGIALFYAVLWLVGRIAGSFAPTRQPEQETQDEMPRHRSHNLMSPYTLQMTFYTLIAGGVGGTSLWGIAWLLEILSTKGHMLLLSWAVTTFGVSLVVGIFSLIVIFHLGLAGRMFLEPQREWWSRLGAVLLMFILGWAVISGFAIFSPAILVGGSELVTAALTSGWLLSTIGGVLAARAGVGSDSKTQPMTARLVGLTPYIFISGFLAVLALVIQSGLAAVLSSRNFFMDINEFDNLTIKEMLPHLLEILNQFPSLNLLATIAVGTAITWFLSRRININLFSLHHFYRNRLTQCYLGATRGNKRRPHPFTGLDYQDDLPLTKLQQRPFQIINTAVNFTSGEELAWQDRKATSFIFTAHYSGFQIPKTHGIDKEEADQCFYRPTQEFASSAGELTLGTALAVSGAAAAPSQGFNTNPAMAFLLTLFNVRLGRWIGNPKTDHWRESDPKMGLKYMTAELTANTNLDSDYVYLSDGGHFDNTGVYELVRRKCRVIVLCDAGQDTARTFDDLGNIIRKCRTDFGVYINIDLEKLRSTDDRHRCDTPWAEGTIDYGHYAEGVTGKLILIKPSMTSKQGEPVDILNYADANLDFPQQPTSDQFFDEAQFESYRQLGYFTVKNCDFFEEHVHQ